MSTVTLRAEIDVLEVDGTETSSLNKNRPKLVLRTHLMKCEWVVLEIGEKSHAVALADLSTIVRSLQAM